MLRLVNTLLRIQCVFLTCFPYVDEEHSISHISLVTSETGIPGPCGTGFMVQRTLGYFTCFLLFRFVPEMKIHTNTEA